MTSKPTEEIKQINKKVQLIQKWWRERKRGTKLEGTQKKNQDGRYK